MAIYSEETSWRPRWNGQDYIGKYLPLTESTYYILLALVEPLHGYGVMQKVEAMSDGTVKIGPGTLYGAFQALEKEGLIIKVGEEERRKIYALTGKGREVLKKQVERLGSWCAMDQRSKVDDGGRMNTTTIKRVAVVLALAGCKRRSLAGEHVAGRLAPEIRGAAVRVSFQQGRASSLYLSVGLHAGG